MENHKTNLRKELLQQLQRKIHKYQPYSVPELTCVVPESLITKAREEWTP